MAEGVCWFEHHGSAPLDLFIETTDAIPDSRQPGTLAARIEVLADEPAASGLPGATVRVPVRITNLGNTLWLHEPRLDGGHVALGGHLVSAEGVVLETDWLRTRLPRDVPPGDTVDVVCPVEIPASPGPYRLELDMVDEGIAWFGNSRTVLPLISLRPDSRDAD